MFSVNSVHINHLPINHWAAILNLSVHSNPDTQTGCKQQTLPPLHHQPQTRLWWWSYSI